MDDDDERMARRMLDAYVGRHFTDLPLPLPWMKAVGADNVGQLQGDHLRELGSIDISTAIATSI
jgi:hypothetical protein